MGDIKSPVQDCKRKQQVFSLRFQFVPFCITVSFSSQLASAAIKAEGNVNEGIREEDEEPEQGNGNALQASEDDEDCYVCCNLFILAVSFVVSRDHNLVQVRMGWQIKCPD